MSPQQPRRKPPAAAGSGGGRTGAARGAGSAGRGAGAGSRAGGVRGAGGNRATGRGAAAGGRGARTDRGGAARRGASTAGWTGGGRQQASRRAQETSAGAAGLGGEQVEGRRAVRELFVAGRRAVREVWLVDGADDAGEPGAVEELAEAAGVPVRRVGAGRLAAAARTAAPQGVIAFADPLPEVDLLELVTGSARPGVPFLVVLDGVTDPHNLGAVLRAAECAGATGAVVPRHRSAQVTATVAKVAAGAAEHLPLAVVSGIPSALSELARLGVWTVGLAADGTAPLFGLELATSPLALVLGSEGRGLSRLARARCDVVARIPLGGAIESLNVAGAAAVACFEVLRQREAAGAAGNG